MSTDQVNSGNSSSESAAQAHLQESPAQTAYNALQEAEQEQAVQSQLPLPSTDDDAAQEAGAGSEQATGAQESGEETPAEDEQAAGEQAETGQSENGAEAASEPVEPVESEAQQPQGTESDDAEPEHAGPELKESEGAEAEAVEPDPFAAFSAVSATSLMFHAPDTDAIRAAAERAAVAREEARQAAVEEAEAAEEAEFEDPEPGAGVTSKRRRRRRRGSVDMELEGGNDDDPPGTVTRIRTGRVVDGSAPTTVQSVKGSTRLEAKKQRRRESRQSGRRRHVITEAEFLARRESVERKMVVREKDDRIQIGVLEDGVLAEHFVSHTQQDSLIGNVYLGKVQNVLPSMEAAFVDIGRGRNAVLYAGEVNWDDADLGGSAKRIENALKPGDPVLVQVTKDPVGHKGARLTSQVSLPGRYLVYVPGGSMTGISRKLPDVERQRLKKILKDHLPDGAGVIVRTAAEGASEQELTNDINRLRSQWEQIQEKAGAGKTLAPEMLYTEPDLTIKTVRDVFNEDFTSMTVQGQAAWDNIEAYVTYVAPDLLDRVSQWTEQEDLFEHHKVDEQIYKALDRKVMLPSGGSLVIDRTEAMTVVDVNTGKFTGSGGNLEETVTKNNLEAAEEIVRQLRLRDIGGIIVIDFIDMVLEANRDLVLRRLVECLGRDRTKHQVAEVTSLGLVQMTRKRMGTGLLEIFSEPCEACEARGVVIHDHPLKGKGGSSNDHQRHQREERKRKRRSGGSGGSGGSGNSGGSGQSGSQQNGHNGASEDPEQAKRAEATRHAFAAIASASHHDEDTSTKEAAQDGGTDDSRHKGGNGKNRFGSKDSGSRNDEHSQEANLTQEDGSAQGGPEDSRAAEDDGAGQRDGGRRRRKRRGKRSRNRGQGDAQSECTGEQETGRSEDTGSEDVSARETGASREGAEGTSPQTDRSPRAAGTGAQPAADTTPPEPQPTRRRSRGARRAAAPVGTPETGSEPAPQQSASVTAGTAEAVKGGAAQEPGTDGSQVTIKGQVIDLPHGQNAPGSGRANGAAGPASLDSLADSMGERAPGETAPRRKRRSRRASAPTGTPGGSGTPSTE